MSRYFFDVKNGHRLIDPAGLDCRDDKEAIEAGSKIARQIASDAPPKRSRHVEVLNSKKKMSGAYSLTTEAIIAMNKSAKKKCRQEIMVVRR
jgi:hypothetical protein